MNLNSWEFWSDLIGALGALALFKPALFVNRIRKSAATLDSDLQELARKQSDIKEEQIAVLQRQVDAIRKHETSWSRWDERLLWLAIVAFFVSFVFKLVHHWVSA